MQYSRYPSILKHTVKGSILVSIFKDLPFKQDSKELGNIAWIQVGTCQGAVHQNQYKLVGKSVDRYALIIPTSIYNVEDVNERYSRWIKLLQQLNPNLKLHFCSEAELPAKVLNVAPRVDEWYTLEGDIISNIYSSPEDGTLNWHLHNASAESFGFSEIFRTYKYVGQILTDPNCIVIEFPNDRLAALTVTLARYLQRSPYTIIPQFTEEIMAHGYSFVQALVLAHYGVLNWVSIPQLTKLKEFVESNSLKFKDWGTRPSRERYELMQQLESIVDCSNERYGKSIYHSYYGLILPHVINWNKFLTLTDEQLVSRVGSGLVSNLNDLIFFLQLEPEVWNSRAHFHVTDPSSWRVLCTHLSRHPSLFNKMLLPAREISEAGVSKSIPEFIEVVKEKSKQIYE